MKKGLRNDRTVYIYFMDGGGEEGGSERVTGLFKVTQLVWDANPITSDPKVKILSAKTLPCATH